MAKIMLAGVDGKVVKSIEQRLAPDGLISFMIVTFTDGTAIEVSSTGHSDGTSSLDVEVVAAD
jgi:hypothetical protein